MPAWASTSPAVVIVPMPETKVSLALGMGTGDQRIWPSGSSPSSRVGAVRQWPLSILAKRPLCRTVGRMR